MTELGLGEHPQDENVMKEDDHERLDDRLSPSAHSLLKVVNTYESGGQLNLFQETADTREVIRMLDSYRGSLYSSLIKRLEEVIGIGGVSIISQRDIIRLIQNLWNENISSFSKTELPFLGAALQNPGGDLSKLSEKAELSYAQARRAQKRLTHAGVLRIRGMLNAEKLALQRIAILTENPSILLTGPYIRLHLLVDGYENLVLSFGVVPTQHKADLMDAVRSTRTSNGGTTTYRLSPGRPRFNGLYFGKNGWKVDLTHFQLMLRNDNERLAAANPPTPSAVPPTGIRATDVRIVDSLLETYTSTASEIQKRARVSTATAFRRRQAILEDKRVLPRARIQIPSLSDRILCICSPESAANILEAWNCLPLTNISLIVDFEAPREKKLLLMAALPAGSGREIIRIVQEEVSRVAPFKVFVVSAGIADQFRISTLFDHKKNLWKWGPQFMDVRNYSNLRRDASHENIPIDFAI